MNRCRVLLAIVLVILVGCGQPTNTPAIDFLIPVEVTDIKTDTVEDIIFTTGTVRTRENVVLTIQTPGFLALAQNQKGIRLEEGMSVISGDLIAQVTGEDARLAAGIEASQEHLRSAKTELERRQQLFKQRLISEAEVWAARTQYEDRLLAYETSQRTFEKTRITTPIDGTILELARDSSGQPIADGQTVNQGMSIARIAPLDKLIADLELVGPEYARVVVGQKVRISHYAFTDRTLEGIIIRLSPTIDSSTRTFRVEVEVDNDEELLRPGMFIQAGIVAKQAQDVIVAPRDGITQRGGRNVVFVIEGQRVVQRDVLLGLADDLQFEVSQGLLVGDRIAIRGLETLTDGTRVRVITP